MLGFKGRPQEGGEKMLLRSSSTPILGSRSLLHSNSPTTHHHHPPIICHVSDSSDHQLPSTVRRSSSDGNLHTFIPDHSEETHHHPPPRTSSRPLETIPSFSIYNQTDIQEVQEQEDELDEVPPLGGIAVMSGFGFEKQEKMGLGEDGNGSGGSASPLFLARGLGIDRIGSGLLSVGGYGGYIGGGEQSEIEGYYKRMIEEDPSNAIFLKNYAQFLYQTKGDHQRAEEYYSRAILSDPGDGELLSQYAKLLWELHRDEERASAYFERSVQAAPGNSHVLAAYAGFLWEAEADDSDGIEDGQLQEQDYVGTFHYGAAVGSAT